MRSILTFRVFLPLAAGLGLYASALGSARAADPSDFVISENDGYGIAECMKPGQECGRVMADAWCEAHGHGHASAFGLAEDVTGATKVSTAVATPVQPNSVVIHCGE